MAPWDSPVIIEVSVVEVVVHYTTGSGDASSFDSNNNYNTDNAWSNLNVTKDRRRACKKPKVKQIFHKDGCRSNARSADDTSATGQRKSINSREI